MLLRLSGLCLWLAVIVNASAHQMSTGYLNLDFAGDNQQQFQGQFQLRWFDLNSQVSVDKNLDGQLAWTEVKQQEGAILNFIQQHLSFTSADQPCPLRFNQGLQSVDHFDEGYLSVSFTGQCATSANSALGIQYNAIFAQDPEHKLVVNVTGVGKAQKDMASLLLTANQQQGQLDIKSSNGSSVFGSYFYQGIVHIFIGTDHILFLLVLVLSNVLIYQQGKWTAKASSKQIFIDTAWVISAFTLAHSITLTATALGWIAPSSRWVEVGIAFSIVITALNNVWPLVTRLGMITFAFGLLHGMGFASVLGELGLSQNYTLLSILAFNLGVEAGQLMILVLILPVLFWGRNKAWYSTFGLKIPSLIIALIAMNWTIQRI